MSAINNANKIYLGSVEVDKVYYGSSLLYPLETYWEDFETTSRLTSINGSIIGNWDRIVESGNTVLNYNTAANTHSCVWDDANTYSASATFNLEAKLKVVDGGTNLAMLVFGKQAGNNFNAYQVVIDRRNLTGGSAAFQLRLNNSTSPLATSTAHSIITNNWYKVVVEWRMSGTRITAKLYDDTNTLLTTITSNSTTYTSGRIGVHGYNQTSFDNIKLTI